MDEKKLEIMSTRFFCAAAAIVIVLMMSCQRHISTRHTNADRIVEFESMERLHQYYDSKLVSISDSARVDYPTVDLYVVVANEGSGYITQSITVYKEKGGGEWREVLRFDSSSKEITYRIAEDSLNIYSDNEVELLSMKIR